jgi:hypothetical protein
MRKQNDYGKANQQRPRDQHHDPQEDPLNPLTLQHGCTRGGVPLSRKRVSAESLCAAIVS